MKKSIMDIDVRDERILMRADLNVPLRSEDGTISVADDYRIRAALPTISRIVDGGGRLAICAHLGRPKGERRDDMSLRPVARRLSELLDQRVGFADDCVGESVEQAMESLGPGEIVLLENTRFHPGEKKNEPRFAKSLAAPFSLFVNDAFGAAHRAHASTAGVADHLPSVQGLLMAREVEAIASAVREPNKPMVAILGGAKISDKIGVLRTLATRADTVITGGGIANTILAARGARMGNSLVESDAIEQAREIDEEFRGNIVVPVDMVAASDISEGAETETVPADAIPDGMSAGDIGPQTIDRYAEILAHASTVIWNGPVGVFEIEAFAKGTREVARQLGGLDATVVCGGGDSAAAVREAGFADSLTHVSTGGGAFLEFIEQGSLPAIEALDDA